MERTDYRHFSKSDLQAMAESAAQCSIIGEFFVGHIGKQTLRWTEDGGIDVLTKYEEINI